MSNDTGSIPGDASPSPLASEWTQAPLNERLQLPDWLADGEQGATRGDDMIEPPASIGERVDRPLTEPVSPEHLGLIEASWQRSRQAGLRPGMDPDFTGASPNHVKSLLDESHQLGSLAYPVLEALYEQIANTHSMVLLTSAKGLVLHSLGDTDFVEKA